jgi:integrative and conjugative element protein (TIGR02256 family)
MPALHIRNPSLVFRLPTGLGSLELSPQVLQHLDANRQRRLLSREAGGQLFATFEDPSIMNVVDATGPRPTDRRSLYNYQPDRIAEKAEIRDRYARGLHYMGDWHTHRQKRPTPSPTDEHNINELVRLSSHDLAGFILVIVGQASFPDGLHVSFHSKTNAIRLLPTI